MKTFTSIILLSTSSSIVNGQIATRRGAKPKPTSSLSSSIVRTRVLRGNNNDSHLLQQSRRETKAEKKDTTGSAKAEKNDPSMKSNKMMKAKSAKSSSSKGGMVATSTNIDALTGDSFLTSAGDNVEFMSLSLQDDDMSMMNLDAMSIPEGSTPQDGDVVSQEDEEEAAFPIQDPLARGSANIKSSSICIGAVLVGTFIMLW